MIQNGPHRRRHRASLASRQTVLWSAYVETRQDEKWQNAPCDSTEQRLGSVVLESRVVPPLIQNSEGQTSRWVIFADFNVQLWWSGLILAHNMHRTGLKSSWCNWSRGRLSSSSFSSHLEKSWSSSLWNSQNTWQSSFSTSFVLWLFFSVILWQINSRQRVIEFCTFTKILLRLQTLESFFKWNQWNLHVECNTSLPCSCCLSHGPSCLLVLLCSFLWILSSSHVDCGFRLGLFFWGFVRTGSQIRRFWSMLSC